MEVKRGILRGRFPFDFPAQYLLTFKRFGVTRNTKITQVDRP